MHRARLAGTGGIMIYQPVPLQAPVLHVGAHYTFVGIFVEYQSECETMYRTKGWAESTKEQYDSIIRNVIYPHLDNHNYKPIADYTREDFDRAIQKITASGKKRGPSKDNQYDESTIQTFKRLIRTIITVAYENGKILYNIYADDFSETNKQRLLEYYRLHNIQPKSFSVAQEYSIAQYLSNTCLDHGESVGLLLMFSLGLRCAEAAGASFDDIIQIDGYPHFYCLRILHTTGINTNSLGIGGKTENANRLIPLPDSIHRILRQIEQVRIASLQTAQVDLTNQKLPMACKGTKYLNRCDTPTLSRAGREMFQAIGMRKEYITAISLAIEQDCLAAKEMSAEEEFALVEQEPTAYAMRRNTATHLYNVGLDDNQTSYIMGHKIYDGMVMQKEYSSPELLYEIKKKMDLRPILNAIPDIAAVQHMERSQVVNLSGAYEQIIHIPPYSSATITATPYIPGDDISICDISEENSNAVRVQQCGFTSRDPARSRQATMMRLYHKMYKDVIHDYVIGL